MQKGFSWRTWFFGIVLILVCLFPSVRVGFCVSEDMALKETQRRMIEQTAHRLDQKEERLKSVEGAIKDRSGQIEHHLQELEALWERQHLILGVSKGDFFSSRDLYLINTHLQGIVESLIQGPQEDLQRVGDDQAWTEKVLNKTGEYQQPLSGEEAPLRPEREAGIPQMAGGGLSVPQGGTQAGTLLVIEDEPQVRRLAERMLKLLGFTALTAEDGVEGVKVFKEHRDEIRLVLCEK